MDDLHQKFNLHPIYFFLVAEIKGKYDKNTNIHNPEFQELIKTIAAKYPVAIHPSWYSSDHPSQLKREKQWLENISQKTIISSRQHYLRFNLPYTFQRLLSIGIKNEYSMGYGTINGFRASIASSFYWYDLEKRGSYILIASSLLFYGCQCFLRTKIYSTKSF